MARPSPAPPADAPEIDGAVIIGHGKDLMPGEFTRVRVTAAGEHDLWAKPI